MKINLKIEIFIILGIFLISFVFSVNFIDDKFSHNKYSDLETAKSWDLTGSPIIIDDSDPTKDWAFTESNYDWCSGAGTQMDPYIIENVTIDGKGSDTCIEIKNSNAYFQIRNCNLYNGFGLFFNSIGGGIKLDHVTNGMLVDNNFSLNILYGIYLFYSEEITISKNNISNNYNGIYVSWSTNNHISDNILQNNTQYGIFLDNSDLNTLSGNNMTNCGIGIDGIDRIISYNDISDSNLVNQKPVRFYKNTGGLIPTDFTNAGQIILINCHNCIIEDVNTSRSSCGIALLYSDNNSIRFINSSYNADRGIFLRYSDYNLIYENNVHHNGHETQYHDRGGIVLLGSSYTNISSNFLNHNSEGISIQNGGNNTLYNNTANYNTKCGINLECSNTSLYENRMKGCGIDFQYSSSIYSLPVSNEVNQKPVYYYKGLNNLVPTDFTNAGQIILINCNKSLISNLDLSYGSCGVSLFDCHDNIFSYNNASHNTMYGIFLDAYSSNNKIAENNFIENIREGIKLYADYNLISKNIIIGNTSYGDSTGIRVMGNSNNFSQNKICNYIYGMEITGYYNSISENDIFNNSISGINMAGGRNWFINNNISYNGNSGIKMAISNNNQLKGNLIEKNIEYGVIIGDERCVNNSFYNNFFISNGIQAEDNSSKNSNFWDNGSIGNYWDDYNCNDVNDDGIGDDPYNITGSAEAKDNYPIWRDEDDVKPQILINTPTSKEIFGKNSPNFDVDIIDQTLNSTWYRLCNESIFTSNITFEYLVDTIIKQEVWNLVGNGSVVISFFANDSLGRFSYKNVTVRKDIIKPTWKQYPSDQINEFGISFSYDLNATDPSGIDSYWINDTNNFQINGNGILTNNTFLSVGDYWVEIYINDSVGNINSSIIKILVQDTTSPTWIEIPSDQINKYGISFSYNVRATDLSGIDYYWINDSVRFQIDSNGIITNATILSLGEYWLEIRAYDSYGNCATEIFKVTINAPEEETPPPSSIPGYNFLLFNSILSVSILIVLIQKKVKF
ncbi:MAG: hypothetical protein EU551_04170 [Promethearchaeota archaeon]|nr:MAG: hypothetical protein EU551_04170 [Candidatus Lokiarchaeota archaeon]